MSSDGKIDRRDVLKLIAAAPVAIGAAKKEARVNQPALFISHGSPMMALEDDAFTAALESFSAKLEKPRAIVVISAHFQSRGGVAVLSNEHPSLVYDFGGFPEALYQVQYPAPGSPLVAARIVALLEGAGIEAVTESKRGLDHGAWVPLHRMFPKAEIPVVEVSLPMPVTPAELLAIGRALAPLRSDGVLLIGSGNATHNLRIVDFADKQAKPHDWALQFDGWLKQRLAAFDVKAIADWRRNAPHAGLAHPTSEHFDPLLVVLGSCGEMKAAVDTIFEGFHYGTLSMRSVALR